VDVVDVEDLMERRRVDEMERQQLDSTWEDVETQANTTLTVRDTAETVSSVTWYWDEMTAEMLGAGTEADVTVTGDVTGR